MMTIEFPKLKVAIEKSNPDRNNSKLTWTSSVIADYFSN